MDRYAVSGIEGEYQPGSRGKVLKNKLGIVSKREMDRAEYRLLVAAQKEYLSRVSKDTSITSEMIRQMHEVWLGTLYAWAGHYRTVNVSKGNFTWPPATMVAQNMKGLEEGTLKRLTPFRIHDVEALSWAMAEVQAELLLVHPFREGNGRTARWVCDLMANQAGFPVPEYGFSTRGKRLKDREYLRGVQLGYGRDYEPLARFLREAILLAVDLARDVP